jgi:acyl-CoA thioesterase-1
MPREVISALGVLLLCAAACESTVVPATSSTPVRIAVLGDSLAVSPSRGQGFPAVLQEFFDARSIPATVVNAGIGGDTSAGGLARADAVLAGDLHVLVLALGANDGLAGVPIATVERNLAGIIERAQSRGVKVLLCGMEAAPLHGLGYSIDFHQIFPRLAAKYGTPLVPFLLAEVVFNPELNAGDGVHPNAAGARRIAETIWPYLVPMVSEPNRAG